MQDRVPVVVTTAHEGVFFGYAIYNCHAAFALKDVVKLEEARNFVYWGEDVRGVMDLCVNGPSDKCRVGPASTITLREVTSMASVRPDAVTRWESAPWADLRMFHEN